MGFTLSAPGYPLGSIGIVAANRCLVEVNYGHYGCLWFHSFEGVQAAAPRYYLVDDPLRNPA